MINFKNEEGTFNFRVAGLLFNKDKILIHRGINDDFYALPGGRLEMFESTEDTIVREMKEELGIEVSVNRLLWICEDFYTFNDNKCHEICYYYLIECEDSLLMDKGDLFYVTEGKNKFEFRWVDVKIINNEELYPKFLKDKLEKLPSSIERIVEKED
ncbi:NUDIX hydrolase [Clostridium sp. C8-1-8]|uniref:NUDIX hydrolase n=1 Tax=Clostridium sp. C8-1-8 TaxID=2698831 RepID=UPI0013681353|nr:NUDIX hydrolase [Clostridium sp. C8-1-8]